VKQTDPNLIAAALVGDLRDRLNESLPGVMQGKTVAEAKIQIHALLLAAYQIAVGLDDATTVAEVRGFEPPAFAKHGATLPELIFDLIKHLELEQ
jgi:hypothetical protein